MFKQIRAFLSNLWQSITSFFTRKPVFTAPVFTDKEKYDVIAYLLKGQKGNNGNNGFALRHVDNHLTKNANVLNGFEGDAISYSVTTYIMSLALNKSINICSWCVLESGQISYMTDAMTKPALLDQALAAKIFDCLHAKVLQFIGFNFSKNDHHFMLIKDMNGAATPYDIKDIYPTGKCGKQLVRAKQIIKVFSKKNKGQAKEEMMYDMESGILQLVNATLPQHDKNNTGAILAVLREIKLNASDKSLTKEAVHRRLIEAEVETSWSDSRYHQFYDHGGFFEQFTRSVDEVNRNLDHYRALI